MIEDLVRKIVLNLDSFEATAVGDIPAYMLKSTVNIHLPFITKIINFSFENNCFPDDLKLVEVSLVYKENDDLDKENYRPVSVLSLVPKFFEIIRVQSRMLESYNQVDNFMKGKLSNL